MGEFCYMLVRGFPWAEGSVDMNNYTGTFGSDV